MRHLLLAVAALAMSVNVFAAEPLQVYEGDGLVIRVLSMSADETVVSGEIVKGNDTWPFSGKSVNDDVVKGTFRVGNDSYPFTATAKDNAVTFVTDGTTYNLKKKAGGDGGKAPAVARSGNLKFTTAEFRDINMRNVVACYMLVPEGFTAQGHVEWSQDKTPYPQKKIKVTGPDKSQILFQPAMTFAYWEASEEAKRLNAQMGGHLPDRQGMPPPQELGKWLVEMGRQYSKEATNIRLVSDERDTAAEKAYAEMQAQMPKNPNGGPGTTTIHTITLAYEIDGVPFTEESRFTYSRLPPSVTQNMTSWLWMLFTQSSVRAPTAKFNEMRPILYASATSLTDVPKWFTQSQYVIMLHTQRNFEVGMDEIAKRAEFYDKLREEDMKTWRKNQEISDKQQDARINQIYEVSNFAGPDGSVKKLPNGFKNYWSDGKGGFQCGNSNEAPTEGGEWKPVEPMKG